MASRERTILAIAIMWPEFIPSIIENCSPDFFSTQDHKAIFQVILGLHGAELQVTLPSVADKVFPAVSASQVASLLDELIGVPNVSIEKFLFESILAIKKERAKKKLLTEISIQAMAEDVDFDEIKNIIGEVNVIDRVRENSDIEVQAQKYRDWINRPRTSLVMGFPSLDRHTDTLNYGELVTIMGRTTTGKTFLGLTVLINMVRGDGYGQERFGFFSMEQPGAAVFERLLQISQAKTRYDLKLMNDAEREPIIFSLCDELHKVKIYEKIYSVAEISRVIKEEKFTVIFVDFLDLIRSGSADASMYQQATQKMRELKQAAKTENCLIILLVQLSRTAGDGTAPVTMDMARDSGAIEELSDFMFGIWREKPNNQDPQDPYSGQLVLALLKNKRGPIQNIPCLFDKKIGRIRELEMDATQRFA